MMTHLTIRHVPPELAEALERRKRARGVSLNQTVLDLLRQATGVGMAAPDTDNGLRRHAGTWGAAEGNALDAALREFSGVDAELWETD